ncbi:MAG: hypothetical protein Q8R96_11520 [Bacteroidota bacterium]|nr:hypothetical protein [Bacteroidota bacterium]
MNSEWKQTKERIKSLAKLQGKYLNDILSYWNISLPGFDKRLQSGNFNYSRHVHDLALFLNCSIEDITQPQPKPIVNENQVKEQTGLYKKSVVPDDKILIEVLKTENEMLKRINFKQEKEIEFLRGLLNK